MRKLKLAHEERPRGKVLRPNEERDGDARPAFRCASHGLTATLRDTPTQNHPDELLPDS